MNHENHEILAAIRAGSRPWHHAHSAGFMGMQNANVVGPGRLLSRFQKAWEGRQTVFSVMTVQEAVKVKPKG